MYPIIIYFIYNVTIYFLFITYLYEIKRRPHSQSELAVFFFFEMYYSLLTMKMNEGKQLLFARCREVETRGITKARKCNLRNGFR